MKEIRVIRENNEVKISGNGTFDIKMSKYGFIWDKVNKCWIGNESGLEIVEKYISNFKNDKIRIIK